MWSRSSAWSAADSRTKNATLLLIVFSHSFGNGRALSRFRCRCFRNPRITVEYKRSLSAYDKLRASAVSSFYVIPTVVEESLTISVEAALRFRNIERCLDSARHDRRCLTQE